MTNAKMKFLLILAIICMVLFGRLFWIVTKPETTDTETANNLEYAAIEENTTNVTGNILTGDIGLSTLQTGGPLTILLPGRFYNEGFQQLAQKIKTDYNVIIHYKKIENMAYFRQIIQGEKELTGIDLYLVPSDWLGGYQGKNIGFEEDIAPYFDVVFSQYITSPQTTFIPYAIDPLITIVPDTNTIPTNQLTFKDLAAFIVQQGGKSKVKMPIIRGLDKNDIRLLEQGGESFPNYFLITYNLIHELYRGGNSNDRNIFENTISDTTISKRSYANFKGTFSKLLKKNKYCATFPDICIIAYNLGDSKFGFLSDIVIQEKYFGGLGQKITQPTIYGFPVTTADYKVRGRGFIPSRTSEHDENIKIFLKEYLLVGVNNTAPLRQNMLSAFNNILDIQKIQKKYEPVTKFQPVFSLMRYTPAFQKDFLEKTDFISIVKEKNSASNVEFFKERDRQW